MTREDIKETIIKNINKINEDNIKENTIITEKSRIKENAIFSSEILTEQNVHHWSLSSLQVIDLIINLENLFDIELDAENVIEFNTIGDLITLIEKNI